MLLICNSKLQYELTLHSSEGWLRHVFPGFGAGYESAGRRGGLAISLEHCYYSIVR